VSGSRSDNSSVSQFGHTGFQIASGSRNPKIPSGHLPTSDLVLNNHAWSSRNQEFAMLYPAPMNRVRVSDRDGEFIVVRVDHSACLVDLWPAPDGEVVERNVAFALLSASSEPDLAPHFRMTSTLDAMNGILASSWVSIHVSRLAITDLRDLMRDTQLIIGATQELIAESDRVIAGAARFWDPTL